MYLGAAPPRALYKCKHHPKSANQSERSGWCWYCHSLAHTRELCWTAVHFYWNWELSLRHPEINVVWIEGVLPPTADLHLLFPAPGSAQHHPVWHHHTLLLPTACARPCCLTPNVSQFLFSVKLNQRLCFSWYVCVCRGNFALVLFIVLVLVKGA